MRGCVQLVQVLQASAPHLATPTNFFLGLAFSGPLSSPHAYATRACPTLGWPLPSYKPGSPRALTCSPLRACQSCLPGAWCVFLLPSPQACALCIHPTSYSCRPNFTLALRSPRAAATRAYGLLALSSAPFLYSLHRLVSQPTRNMIDWLGLLFPCAFLYTTDSPVACGVRVCKLLPCSNLSLPFPFATCLRHACLLNPRPAFIFLQALHSPRATLQPSWRVPSCLSDAWCVFLLPSRAYAIRVCPTLGSSLSWIPHLGRINATRCEAVCSLCRCCWHSCLLCSVLAAPTVRATRVCPTYYVLLLPSYELLPSVSAQSLMRVAPARH